MNMTHYFYAFLVMTFTFIIAVSANSDLGNFTITFVNQSDSYLEVLVNFTTYKHVCRYDPECNELAEQLSCSDTDGCTRKVRSNTNEGTFVYPTLPIEQATLSCDNSELTINITSIRYKVPRRAYCTNRLADTSLCVNVTQNYNCATLPCNEARIEDPFYECAYFDSDAAIMLRDYCLKNSVSGECVVGVPRRMVPHYQSCTMNFGDPTTNCSLEYNLCYALWADIGYLCEDLRTDSSGVVIAVIATSSVLLVAGTAATTGIFLKW